MIARFPRIFALAAGLASAPVLASPAPDRPVRGPIESRDEFLLAQSLLTLPPMGPALLAAGATEVRLDADWGNDFGIEADPGGRLADVLFFVDGEHRSAALTVRRGFGGGWTLGARMPLHWRGGGWLDSVIDPFHDLFGFPDSGRPLYPRGRLRLEGRTREQQAIAWAGRAGSGTGSLEVEAGRVLRGVASRGPAIAIIARGALPLSTGAFADGGGGVGAQVVASLPLSPRFDAHGGLGGTALGPAHREGIDYARNRAHGFAALEWRPIRAWSALVQWEASSRLVTGIDGYPAAQLALRLGSKVDLGPRWRVEGGFVEGIKDLDATVDFGVFLAVSRRGARVLR